ncbi:MAG TPA: PLP-dependent aminotransferase family protein [Caulobacteraceae bacterium]|jgi:DNA-binding transcriptional MocR family regulator
MDTVPDARSDKCHDDRHDDWRPDLTSRRGPLYLAIADALEEDVRSGRLAPGCRLPPQRRLAQHLGVDLTTVTRAYDAARERGLIEAAVGQGTFVKGLIEAPSRRPDLSMNLPPLFHDPALAARIWREAGQIETLGGLPLLLGYQDAAGTEDDRLAAVDWLKPRLPGLTPERMVVAAGVQGALVAVFGLICRRGDVVCAERLTYPGFRALAGQLGLELVAVDTDAQGLLPEAFETACRERQPKALYCTPTLHNPTTATLPLERRVALARIARAHGVAIVEDDAYGPLKPDAPPPIAALAPEIAWHVAGLAKVMSPALRIAYMAAPSARDASRIAAVQRATVGRASPLTALIATHWIRTGLGAALLEAIRGETRARHASVRRRLPHGLYAADPDAFHLWLCLPKGWTRGLLAGRLLAAGVAVVPSDVFCIGGEPPEAVRLSLGAFPTREAMDLALDRIADLLERDPAFDLPIV